jgi:hypothetical protein
LAWHRQTATEFSSLEIRLLANRLLPWRRSVEKRCRDRNGNRCIRLEQDWLYNYFLVNEGAVDARDRAVYEQLKADKYPA